MSKPWQPRICIFSGLFVKGPVIVIGARLGITSTHVVGCLVRFWLDAQVKADKQGILQGKTIEWVDLLVGVTGFAEAMVFAGWLRLIPSGLEVVNFDKWISKKTVKRIENAERQAERRSSHSSENKCDNRPLTATPGHEVPVAPKVPKKASPKQANVTDVRFWKFWSSYPRKWNQPAAYKEWTKLNPDDALVETILASIEAWKSHPQWSKDNGEYIPNPVNWLAGRRWQDSTDGGRGVPGGPRLQPKPGGYRTGRSYSSDAGDPVPPGPDPDGGGGPSLF